MCLLTLRTLVGEDWGPSKCLDLPAIVKGLSRLAIESVLPPATLLGEARRT